MFRLVTINGRAALDHDGSWHDLAELSGDETLADPLTAVTCHRELHALYERGAAATSRGLVADAVLDAPVPRPRQAFGIGLNYRDHAGESGAPLPPAPLTFTKFPSCIAGPTADVPLSGTMVDWEVEIVAVIGDEASHVSVADAWSAVAGLTLGQDISDRAVQMTGVPPQFSLGKSFANYGPIGPALVSIDAFADPDDIALWCDVAGERMQKARSSQLIFSIPTLVAYLSSICTLYPGDLIFTGTPSGVGMARGRYLAPGEIITSGAEVIGELSNTCVPGIAPPRAMTLHRLLGFRAAVADPTALADYYAELGLTGDADSGYTGSDGGAGVLIDEAPFRRLVSVDIGCHDERDLDAVEERLENRGANPRRDSESITVVDAASRVQTTVRIAEPEAVGAPAALVTPNTPGAATRVNERSPAVFGAARPPRRLGHLVIGTPDLRATRDLLVDGIGCKVSDEVDGIIHFLRCSTDHHNIGLVHSPVPILQHYSWECDDIDHVGHTATALYRADTNRHAWGLGRHFAGSNFYWYLRDPAGSFLELYSDFDRIDDDAAWERHRSPLSIEHAANVWGPNLPTEFVVPDDLAALEAGWERIGT